ncbi:MAG: hypothetical protein JSV62_00685, partial [Promethearchaeota archaeon]
MRAKKDNFLLLFLICSCLLISYILFQIDANTKDINYQNSKNLQKSAYWVLTSPIEVDDRGVNNWTWAEGQPWFGGGNGTIGNPYIIENVTIDVDNNFDFCISI